jgi:hypothetical protein
MRAIPSLAAALLLGVLSSNVQAQITFHEHDPGALQPPENVLMDSSSGFNVFGHTNGSNTGVIFTSDENINAPAQGQARVEADDGAYRTLCIELAPGFGFKSLEVDVQLAGRTDGNITFDVFGVGSSGLPMQFTSTVSANGSNWFSFETDPGVTMTKVCFTTDVDVADSRQWLLGGVGPLENVPEGSSLALLGTGLLPIAGIVIKRRRAKK